MIGPERSARKDMGRKVFPPPQRISDISRIANMKSTEHKLERLTKECIKHSGCQGTMRRESWSRKEINLFPFQFSGYGGYMVDTLSLSGCDIFLVMDLASRNSAPPPPKKQKKTIIQHFLLRVNLKFKDVHGAYFNNVQTGRFLWVTLTNQFWSVLVVYLGSLAVFYREQENRKLKYSTEVLQLQCFGNAGTSETAGSSQSGDYRMRNLHSLPNRIKVCYFIVNKLLRYGDLGCLGVMRRVEWGNAFFSTLT